MLDQLIKPEIQELIKNRKWKDLRDAVEEWPVPEIAELMMGLEKEDRVLFFRTLPRDLESNVFSHLDSEQQNALLEELTDNETKQLLSNLAPDDRAALINELPAELTKQMMSLLNQEDLKEVRQLLGYPEESVGRFMTPDYVAVNYDWTIKKALEHIRKTAKESETINVIYVTDKNEKLIDVLDIRTFIVSDPEKKVQDIMDDTFVSISAYEDREAAVQMFQKYDKIALPVLDSEGVMLGIITVDDVLDVAEEETTEDFHKTAAVAPLQVGYHGTSIWTLFSKRISWLIILVGVNLVSSGVIEAFEDVLEATIALAFFIPLLIDSGGNSGSQSATIMVRAIATGDVKLREWMRTAGKEVLVGLSLGVAMGLASWMLGIWRGGFEVGIVVGLAMICIVLVANLIGTLLPFILTRLNIDPAVASSPLITTIVDASGLLIYFSIAAAFLDPVALG